MAPFVFDEPELLVSDGPEPFVSDEPELLVSDGPEPFVSDEPEPFVTDVAFVSDVGVAAV